MAMRLILILAMLVGGCRCAMFEVPGPDAATVARLDALETWQRNVIVYENAVRTKVDENEKQLEQLKHDVDLMHEL